MPSSRRATSTKNGMLTYTAQTARGRAAAKKAGQGIGAVKGDSTGKITRATRKVTSSGGRVSADARGAIYGIQSVDKRAKSEGAMKRAATASSRRRSSAAGVAAQKANRAAYGSGTRKSR